MARVDFPRDQGRIRGSNVGHSTRNSFCQQYQWWHHGNFSLRDREQNAVGCQSCRFRSTGTAGNRGVVAKKSSHQAISGIGDVRLH